MVHHGVHGHRHGQGVDRLQLRRRPGFDRRSTRSPSPSTRRSTPVIPRTSPSGYHERIAEGDAREPIRIAETLIVGVGPNHGLRRRSRGRWRPPSTACPHANLTAAGIHETHTTRPRRHGTPPRRRLKSSTSAFGAVAHHRRPGVRAHPPESSLPHRRRRIGPPPRTGYVVVRRSHGMIVLPAQVRLNRAVHRIGSAEPDDQRSGRDHRHGENGDHAT